MRSNKFLCFHEDEGTKTQRSFPEDWNLRQHPLGNFKSRVGHELLLASMKVPGANEVMI
jgi:hypothetical protein